MGVPFNVVFSHLFLYQWLAVQKIGVQAVTANSTRCMFDEDTFRCQQRGSNFRQRPRLRQEFKEKVENLRRVSNNKKNEGRKEGPDCFLDDFFCDYFLIILVMLANIIIIIVFSKIFSMHKICLHSYFATLSFFSKSEEALSLDLGRFLKIFWTNFQMKRQR